MRLRIALAAVALTLAASCVSQPDVDRARAEEARAERIVADFEGMPPGPERDRALVEAVALEARLEAARRELEELTQSAWIQRGVDSVSRGVGGDIPGGAATLLGGVVAAAMWYVRKKFGDVQLNTAAQLADLERRRDASREAQEIAPASKGSGVATQSGVAQAARLAKALQAPVAAPQPPQPVQRAYDPLRWSAGAGVPLPPSHPYDVASN